MLIPFTTVAFATRRLLQRECPVCGHMQIVAPSKVHTAVTCERCDYWIPARKTAAQTASTSR